MEEGLVYKAVDYVYSSATDYADQKGLVDDVVVFGCLTFKDNVPHERIRSGAGVRDNAKSYTE